MKKYKLSESNINEFWNLFFKKPKTPAEIQKVVDNDPKLRQLQKDYDRLGIQAANQIRGLKKTNPDIFNNLVKMGLAPKDL